MGKVFGGWNGMDEEDICADMTNTPSSMWSSSRSRQHECASLIDRRFDSIFSTFCATAYLFVLFIVIQDIFYIGKCKMYIFFLGDKKRITNAEHKYLT